MCVSMLSGILAMVKKYLPQFCVSFMLGAAPVFLSILKLIFSHIARYAPSNKLQNSLKIQVQNCGTYSFTIAYEEKIVSIAASTEGICKQLDFYTWRNALVEYVVDSVKDGHIDMIVAIDALHALGAIVTFSYHLHLYLC